ncbi:TetR/AcrR family transcriptional regulator [Nannocystis sp. ILAH1]|uniref:TetR/AcrR family transcriptional regulator n=1 Tax=Nannocystis sp. ILAH1 TaxID=2996789 RepID=UPI00226DDD3C|nr:TetR/AcrR family transcriptional regulator [Nannocystis sp. ILAH1]
MPVRDPSRRRRILDVAKRLFTERGFRGTTLDLVAEEAGCAKGALYLDFADKEALLREVADETFAAIRERFAAVTQIDSPLARLRETLRFAFREYATEPLFSRLLREDPELKALGVGQRPDQAGAARAQYEMLLSWVDEGIARGEIRSDVDRDLVPAVLGVLRHAPQHVPFGATLGLPAGERVLEAIVDIFSAGLAAPRPATTHKPRKKLRTRS